ncbi:hypothetical protein LTR78_003606 [Recurvomyces mirabilis]|uniref:WHIM1 domain-containing protein n=1 Tax=Recurvomyces mirabilis TaxID=574656 RepID=A0AAE1C343_9PEZI|nr:hypothetical protein LTR78_003606 [Recurvomyces mirabilis]KAK5154721.1 hypothetical protein LTS14_006300 [Recurvomyces mirabilis]
MDSDNDSSGLSEAPEEEIKKLAPIFQKAKKATKLKFPPPHVSPPRPKRPPSPAHEDAFADNPDIAFLVMFRSRFNDVLPAKLMNLGPQDIERGVTDQPSSPEVQNLLCAILGLVNNRKKPVERGHHGRALEEAVLSHKAQWPHSWNGVNPLHGPRDFDMMSPTERLNLLRTLCIWSLMTSETASALVKDRYKQSRHNDDENQPLSVQPWGVDGDKRRYFLIQGLEDTHFRIYREGSRYNRNAHWYSVAGDIEEARALAKKLEEVDGTQAARRLATKITNALPMFEASEEKRRRREYRQVKRAAFSRPEPGFSLYEGRTRGKRMRYTYDDDEQDLDSDAGSARRSARTSARATPLSDGPTYTASGRQIRQPRQGHYGESLLRNGVGVDGTEDEGDELAPAYGARADDEDSDEPPTTLGRATRSAGRPANGASNPKKRKHIDGYNEIDGMSDEEDAAPSGDEWDSDKNEEDKDMPDADDGDDESVEADDEEDEEDPSLVVRLKVSPAALQHRDLPTHSAAKREDGDTTQAGAAASDESDRKGLSTGYVPVMQQHHTLMATPPSAASAYPTPASASFPGPKVEAAVASILDSKSLDPDTDMMPAAHANGVQAGTNGY